MLAPEEKTHRLVEMLRETDPKSLRVPTEKHRETSAECGIPKVGITRDHREWWLVRQPYLAHLGIARVGQAQRACALDDVPAPLEQENRRFGSVVVREER